VNINGAFVETVDFWEPVPHAANSTLCASCTEHADLSSDIVVLWNRSGLSGKTNLTVVWKGPDGRAIPRNNMVSVTTAAIATYEGDEPAAVLAQSLPPLNSFTHVPPPDAGGKTILQWGASSTAVGIQDSTTIVQLPRPSPAPMSAGPGLIE